MTPVTRVLKHILWLLTLQLSNTAIPVTASIAKQRHCEESWAVTATRQLLAMSADSDLSNYSDGEVIEGCIHLPQPVDCLQGAWVL